MHPIRARRSIVASGEDRYDTKAVLGRLRKLWEAAGGRVADGKSARVGYRFFLPYLPPNRPPNWDNVLVRFMIDQEGQWRKGVFHEKKKDDLQIRLNTCLDGVVPPDILENWLSQLKNLGFDRTAVEGASFHIDCPAARMWFQ